MKTTHKLTNKDISERYDKKSFHIMIHDFKGAFAYWAASLNKNDVPQVDKPLKAYTDYLRINFFSENDTVLELSYSEIEQMTSVYLFENIPEILELNSLTPDFISLGALSRNVFYHILREKITQPID